MITSATLNPIYSSSISTNRAVANLIAEFPTQAYFHSLKLEGDKLFRGQCVNDAFSLHSFHIDDLTPSTRYNLTPTGYDDISVLFADEKYICSFCPYGLGAHMYVWNRVNGRLITDASCTIYSALKGDTLLVSKTVKLEDDSWVELPALYDLSQGLFIRFLEDCKPTRAYPLIEGEYIYVQQRNCVGCWNKSGTLIRKYGEEIANIQSLLVDEDRLIAVTSDALYIWNRETGDLIKTFAMPAKPFVYMQKLSIEGGLLFLNSYKKLELWDIATGACLYHLENLRLLCSDEENYYFANNRSEIEIRDKWSGNLLFTLPGDANHSLYIECQVVENFVIKAGADGLKIYNKKSGVQLAVLTEEPIHALAVNNKRIAVQTDNALKLWEIAELKYDER